MALKEETQNLPNLPGVYLMLNKRNSVIYIGKAKSLRNRVKSYFSGSGDARFLARLLLSEVEKIDYLVTDTGKEALILENNLIKKYKPKYNINLKDDKTYFSLKLTVGEKFPKLLLVRKVKEDGARYFGPYSSSQAVKDTLKSIHHLFPLRACRDADFKSRTRPCLNYQIGRCLAPCLERVGEEEYREYVKGATLFLEGRNKELLRLLKNMMKRESERLNFEKAARIRDRISSIEKTIEKQKIVFHSPVDQDVFGLYRQGDTAGVSLLFIRGGRLLDSNSLYFSNLTQSDGEILSSFLHQFYEKEGFIPREIIVPLPIENKAATEEWLREKREKNVSILVPERGKKLSLLKMAKKNAKQCHQTRQGKEVSCREALQEMKRRLGLKKVPLKIECFDISNLKGEMAAGSVVSFFKGKPNRQGYRRYKIRTVLEIDDYGMMHELLKRYLSKLPPEDLPDLLLVDGGKGQLNVALSALEELKMKGMDVVALAKGGKGKKLPKGEEKIRKEKFFLPRRKEPLLLPKNSPALFLLQRIRDESHRFAISYHKKLRKLRDFRSILDDIPGIGPVKKKELLRHFGSIKNIKNASIEEILDTPKINQKDAQKLFCFFRKK